MTEQANGQLITIDEVDQQILDILTENPRATYSEISETLAEEDFEMSSEAVRQRVYSLLEITTPLFMVRPEIQGWYNMVIIVRTVEEPGAKQQTFEEMSELDYWAVGSGFGTVDVYGVAMINSLDNVETLIRNTRNIESLSSMDHIIETERFTSAKSYLQMDK